MVVVYPSESHDGETGDCDDIRVPLPVDMTRCRAQVKYGRQQCSNRAVTEPDENGLRWCRHHENGIAGQVKRQAALDSYTRGVNEQIAALRWRQRMEPLVTDTVRLLAEVERSDRRTPLDERLVQARHALVKVLVELRE